MKKTVYNFAKGRLETIEIDFTQDNTTWFDHSKENTIIHILTDFEDGLYPKSQNIILIILF